MQVDTEVQAAVIYFIVRLAVLMVGELGSISGQLNDSGLVEGDELGSVDRLDEAEQMPRRCLVIYEAAGDDEVS